MHGQQASFAALPTVESLIHKTNPSIHITYSGSAFLIEHAVTITYKSHLEASLKNKVGEQAE